MFHFQLKLGYQQPAKLLAWIRGAASKAGDKVPVIIWKKKNQPDDNALVFLRLKDWEDLHGPTQTEIYLTQIDRHMIMTPELAELLKNAPGSLEKG